MADLAVTAANVLASATAVRTVGISGAALEIGRLVYQDATDSNRWKYADADASLAAAAIVNGASAIGLTLSQTAAAGQPVSILTLDDDLTHGLTGVAAGDVLILSATPGRVAPIDDLVAGMFPHVVMIAKSPTKAVFRPVAGPVAVPV
jgi:hypothetical protein